MRHISTLIVFIWCFASSTSTLSQTASQSQLNLSCLSAEDREDVKRQINEVRAAFDQTDLLRQLKEAAARGRAAQADKEDCRKNLGRQFLMCGVDTESELRAAKESYDLVNKQIRDNNQQIREQILQIRSMYPSCY